MTTTGAKILASAPPGFTVATVGKKILMAVTGLAFVGFVMVHLIGNLQIFIGPEPLNKYAETLQGLGAIKWAFRGFLLIFFLTHIWKGFVLWWENKSARPDSYAKLTSQKSTIASRTMIYSGGFIILFVAYHLWHFTISPVHPIGHMDVYGMVIRGFQNPALAGLYIASMVLLALHLSHAASSMFQTFGLNKPTVEKKLTLIANLFAILIFIGYTSIPVAVLTGFLTTTGGGH